VDTVEIIAVENLPLIKKGDDLAELICVAAKKQNTSIRERDVIVVTHVAVSKAEGNVVDLNEVAEN
jgi:coenzyme F420-0:L-glutamate ligase/coenzyme F420-1:gamma-L-glutamate ligase